MVTPSIFKFADGMIGSRNNELNFALSHLKSLIPDKDYSNLTIIKAPSEFVNTMNNQQGIEF